MQDCTAAERPGSPLSILEQVVGYEDNPTHLLSGPVGPEKPFVQLDPAVRHKHERWRVDGVCTILPHFPCYIDCARQNPYLVDVRDLQA